MASEAAVSSKEHWEGGKRPMVARYGKLMMWFFLVTDAFTFTSFLVSYGLIRMSSDFWPDPNTVFNAMPFAGHANIPLGFVSIMTFILILSSVFVVRAVQEGHRLNKKGVMFWLSLGILGGVAFLACQAWEWTHLIHEGLWIGKNSLVIDPETGETLRRSAAALEGVDIDAAIGSGKLLKAPVNFSNLFFFITGFHGMHVLSGVILNIMGWINTKKDKYQRKGDYEMIEKLGLYWHFVDLVWVFVFLCFYLL